MVGAKISNKVLVRSSKPFLHTFSALKLWVLHLTDFVISETSNLTITPTTLSNPLSVRGWKSEQDFNLNPKSSFYQFLSHFLWTTECYYPHSSLLPLNLFTPLLCTPSDKNMFRNCQMTLWILSRLKVGSFFFYYFIFFILHLFNSFSIGGKVFRQKVCKCNRNQNKHRQRI